MQALVVDDSRAMRLIIRRILEAEGYEVSEASDGKEALELLAAAPKPDLALIDWNMPVLDGLELVSAMRKDPDARQVALMMVTTENESDQIVRALAADKKRWVDFMMRFELGLEKPDPKRAPISAATIAVSYLIGGLVPLVPYMITGDLHTALLYSILCTGVALITFGSIKGKLTGISVVKSGFQTLLVGGLAAAAAFYLAHLFG